MGESADAAFSWEVEDSPSASPSRPSSPPAGSTGEHVGGGGVVGLGGGLAVGGSGIRAGALYGLVRLTAMDFGDCCGGQIGAGQQFCMKPHLACSVASHKRTHFTREQLTGASALAGMFIRGSSGSEDAESLSAFTAPVLPGSRLPQEAFDELELSPCSLLSWQATFQGILDQDSKSLLDPQVKTVLFEDTKSDVKFGYTPCNCLAEDNGFAEWSAWAKSKLAPVDKELGDKATPAVTCILSGGLWQTLVSNVETIQENLLLLGTSSKAQFGNLDRACDNLDYKISLLKALVGDRPNVMGTALVFDAIDSLAMKFSWIKSQPSQPMGITSLDEARLSAIENGLAKIGHSLPPALKAEVEQSLQENLFVLSSPFQTNFARPTLQFLKLWLSSPTDPGNKLSDTLGWVDQRLQSLETNVRALSAGNVAKGSSASTSQVGVGGPFSWSNLGSQGSLMVPPHPQPQLTPTLNVLSSSIGGGASSSGAPIPAGTAGAAAVDLVALAESVRRLRDDVDAIRDQLELEAVEMSSETFKSKSECGVWLTTHHAENVVYMFVDAISFLSLCTCDAHKSEQDAANSRATSAKVRDANTYQTAFIASYSLEVPPLFGKGTHADVTRATRTLAAIPTFEDFYPGGGKEGVKDRLVYYIKDGAKTLNALMNDAFNQNYPAYIVGRAMLSASFFLLGRLLPLDGDLPGRAFREEQPQHQRVVVAHLPLCASSN